MSLKRYLKKRQEKRKLLSEIKDIIIDEPNKELKNLKKFNISTIDEVMKMYINIGNTTYFSGDNDTFEYFIESLFEIINAKRDNLNNNDLIKNIKKYGVMSAHNYNIITYSIILNAIKRHIFKLADLQSINQYIKILGDLTLITENNNYEEAVMETLQAIKKIHDYLIGENMQVNRVYLQNIIISIIHSAGINQHEYLKRIIITETKDMLMFQNVPDLTAPPHVETPPIIEGS